MSFFKTTDKGKCDVTITVFTKDNCMLLQRSSTFDIKPIFKDFKDEFKLYKKDGGHTVRITTTPSCNVKTIKL